MMLRVMRCEEEEGGVKREFGVIRIIGIIRVIGMMPT